MICSQDILFQALQSGLFSQFEYYYKFMFWKGKKGEEKKNLFWKWISIQKSGKKKFRYPGFLTTTVVERVSFFVLKNLINDMIWPIESAQLCFQSIAVKIIAELSRAQHGSPETNASLYGKGGHNAV